MQKNYVGLVQTHKSQLHKARALYRAVDACDISKAQEADFKDFFFRFASLGVLYHVSDTYEEMLTANLVATIEDKAFKHLISEFFTHRKAMQKFIDRFEENLTSDYNIIKEHVVFGIDSLNQQTIDFKMEEICHSPGFKNAIVERMNAREATFQMVTILSEKLERMQDMLKSESTNN
jgi:hypothetical protein